MKFYGTSCSIGCDANALMLVETYCKTTFSRCCSWVLRGSSPASSIITALNLSWLKPRNLPGFGWSIWSFLGVVVMVAVGAAAATILYPIGIGGLIASIVGSVIHDITVSSE